MLRATARRAGAVAVAVGMALLLLPPMLRAQTPADEHREAPEVRKLVLKGVNHVDRQDLEKSISTQASSCKSVLLEPFCLFSHSPTLNDRHYLSRDEMRRDVLRIRVYYWKVGYRDAQVDTLVTPTGRGVVTVTFDVHENEPTRVRKIAVEYDSTLISDKKRRKLTLLKAGDPLNLVMLDSMRVLFQNELWNRGYGDAVVDTSVVVDTATKLGDVTVTTTTNRVTTVGAITVIGNEKVDRSTIMNSLTLKSGGLYRQGDVLESQRNLYESNLFRQATIFVPPQRDSVKRLEITVVEAPLHEARIGAGLTNVDFLQVESRYTAYNLLGGARRLDLTGTVGNLLANQLEGRGLFHNVKSDVGTTQDPAPYLRPTWSASIDFQQPAFLQRPPNSLGVGAFGHRQAVPGVFIDRGYGAQATFTRTLALRAPASINYRYEINRVDASDVYFCVNYGVCDTLSIGALRSHQSLSPLSLTGFIDRSDQPFNPTKGYVARVDLEHASSITRSDYRYNRAFLDAAAYTHRSSSPRHVYSAHLRLGFVRALAGGRGDLSVLHPRKRFYAGGAQSVRGYGENQLGPRILTIAPHALWVGDSAAGVPCDTTSSAVSSCNPNVPTLGNGSFNPQPLGGTSLLEGSVEYRFPLIFSKFDGAVFIDGGLVGESSLQTLSDLSSIARGTGAITPGFGIRYESPVGPIRVDVGINPRLTESLAVVTSVTQNGQSKIVPLTQTRAYATGGGGLLNRLVLHFSIGQAY